MISGLVCILFNLYCHAFPLRTNFHPMAETLKTDALIIGGGVAGLWLLNRLRNAGYSAWLLEQDQLGTGQSIASQGIIHSGLKYVSDGTLNKAAASIADMPTRWRQCLDGNGEVDLQSCRVLSEQFYMLPGNSLRARLLSFLGSKALASKTASLPAKDYPDLFRNHVNGPLYRIADFVLDVPSLLATLCANHTDAVFSIDWQQAHLDKDPQGKITGLQFNDGPRIEASHYVFCCGGGTTSLLQDLDLPDVPMQRRPLQQVMVRHQTSDPAFVHCVSSRVDLTPELTITTHTNNQGQPVWYLGGRLAEDGVGMAPDRLIDSARSKLEKLFPWCDFSKAQWATLDIDRAEARQPDGRRPENASMITRDNLAVCWPTKLTMAPALADRVLSYIESNGTKPGGNTASPAPTFLSRPHVAATPWENL